MRILSLLFKIFFVLFLIAGSALWAIFWYYSKDLPTYQQLSEYRPPVISRVFSSNGDLVGEFAEERRLYSPIDQVPEHVKNAFIAAEDKNFYEHPGVDIFGIVRAMVRNVFNLAAGKRIQGASTITQQVIKNFLLTRERKLARKIKEAILAIRFEKTFTKDAILELYLNEIFLGASTYGITAASQAYFNKSPKDLSISEAAYLAGLPKGPNNYHPERHYKRAVNRRNYVIRRMKESNFITPQEAREAKKTKLITHLHNDSHTHQADGSYFVEEIRRNILDRYGKDVLYNAGLTISSTLDTQLQLFAENALRRALIKVDRSLGWRGALKKNLSITHPIISLEKFSPPKDIYNWDVALITNISEEKRTVSIFPKKLKKAVSLAENSFSWIVKNKKTPIANKLNIGDVVYVSKEKSGAYNIQQIPEINGAFMVMDPFTGRVLAQQGGFTFSKSQFNRATQANRQPGSAFKPFVYAAALEQGYSPTTLVSDDPFYYKDAVGNVWEPQNYDEKSMGNISLRTGIEKSRNLITVRLAQDLGMHNVIAFAKRFGVADNMKPYLPMSLGAGETTLEKMVTAYASFANGGYKVSPTYVDRIQDRNGKNIITAKIPLCKDCIKTGQNNFSPIAEYIIDPVVRYQITSLLEGVVQHGTGRRLKPLGIPIAGKTGTTNDTKDVWFMGYTSNLVFGTYIGYDQPKKIEGRISGGTTAAPIAKDFLEQAQTYMTFEEFKVPDGVDLVNIQHRGRTIKEAMRPWQRPIYSNNTPPQEQEYLSPPKRNFEAQNTPRNITPPSPYPQRKKTYSQKPSSQPSYQKKKTRPSEPLIDENELINLGTGGLY